MVLGSLAIKSTLSQTEELKLLMWDMTIHNSWYLDHSSRQFLDASDSTWQTTVLPVCRLP